MNITITLPLLKIKNAGFDGTFINFKDHGKVDMTKDDELKSIANSMSAASDVFFQTDFTIDSSGLKSMGLDDGKITFVMATSMFGDFFKANAVQQVLEVRFDEIIPDIESKNSGHVYEVLGNEYGVYYNSELLNTAREFALENMKNNHILDTIGNIDYLEDFMDAILVASFAKLIRNKIFDDENEDFVPDDAMNSDKKLILWMVKEDEDFVIDNLYEFIDDAKMATILIMNVEDATAQMEGFGDVHVFTGTSSADGTQKKIVHIFKRG